MPRKPPYPDKSNDTSDVSLVRILAEQAMQRTALSEEYDNAVTMEELMLIATDRVSLAAFQLMSSFRFPRRGLYIIWLLKRVHRSSYDRYWKQQNNLFSECTVFVVARLKDFILTSLNLSLDHQFFRRMTTWAGVNMYTATKMSSEEIARFKSTMANAIARYEDGGPKTDAEQINQITRALGRKPRMREIVNLTQSAILHDPLRLIEPIHFARNYQRLIESNP